MINRDRLVNTFCNIVSIDSPSGEEVQMAKELTTRLKSLKLQVNQDAYGNLIANDGRDNPIMLSAHMDTVEPGRGIKPKIDGDRIVSGGTTILGGDAKAGVSVILEALESIREDDASHLPLEVVLTREEELALRGAKNLDMSMIRSKEAIVFDGEGPVSRITSASPTYIGFDIEITGRAAHAGVEPEKGISAIRIASELVNQLPNGRLDQETTFNVGTFESGSTRNTVPETAIIRGEFRSINIENIYSLKSQLKEIISNIRSQFPEAKVHDNITTEFHSYTLPNDDPSTHRVKKALESLGLTPLMKPSGGGTDGNVFRLNGINSTVVGMADNNMHSIREFVTIPDLVDAAHFCEQVLRS